MNNLHDYRLAVKREHGYYQKGLVNRQEYDHRLQELAQKYDRKIFRMVSFTEGR